jgi:uncharacterized membrane protein
MKRWFVTGLIIVLPLAITVWILLFLIHLCTKPFTVITHATLDKLDLFGEGFLVFSHNQIINFLSTLFILFSLFLLLFIVGFITRKLFFHAILNAFERIVSKIPFFNKVYRACRDFTDVIFSPKESVFSKVVWAPFPTGRQGALGLVTNEVFVEEDKLLVSVFVPGAPNPMHGFLVLCPKETVVSTSLAIDESMKWIISCGSSNTDSIMQATHELGLLQSKEG